MVKEPGQRPDFGQSGYPGGATPRQGTSGDTMAENAMAAAESAKSAATEKVEQHKRAASESIDAFAQAVRRASDELSNQDQTAAAQLIKQAAGSLESLSRTLANRSLGDMISSVREFGRRNPVALAGGAALLGLALGRVARTAAGGAEASNGSGEWSSPSSQPGIQRARSGMDAGSIAGRGGSGSANEYPGSRASTSRATSPSHSTSQAPSSSSPQTKLGSGSTSGLGQSGSGSQSASGLSQSGSGSQSRTSTGSLPQDGSKPSGGA